MTLSFITSIPGLPVVYLWSNIFPNLCVCTKLFFVSNRSKSFTSSYNYNLQKSSSKRPKQPIHNLARNKSMVHVCGTLIFRDIREGRVLGVFGPISNLPHPLPWHVDL